MKILPVRKIAFYGQTGDNRSPESFPFPAAMTSVMEYLGEDVRPETLEAHDRKYLRRGMNVDLTAAGGIGFALLWDESHCPSAQDLLQAAPYGAGIDRMFAYVGWEYERVTGAEMKAAAVKAIDEGRPLIALGLLDCPEAALVCGYDDMGDTLIGWSHFQDGYETAENGMFRKSGWADDTWELIIPTKKTEKTLDVRGVIEAGAAIMRQEAVEGYKAGQAAYDRWIGEIEKSEGINAELYDYHHAILFNMAEARCWCGDFLRMHGVEAGAHFAAIHDLCWQADAAARSAEEMAEPEKKAALMDILRRIQAEELAALNELTIL